MRDQVGKNGENQRSESGREAPIGCGTEGPERSEAKAEDKGEPGEAAAEIEAGGRPPDVLPVYLSVLCYRSQASRTQAPGYMSSCTGAGYSGS